MVSQKRRLTVKPTDNSREYFSVLGEDRGVLLKYLGVLREQRAMVFTQLQQAFDVLALCSNDTGQHGKVLVGSALLVLECVYYFFICRHVTPPLSMLYPHAALFHSETLLSVAIRTDYRRRY